MAWVKFSRRKGRPRGAKDKRPRRRKNLGIGGHTALVAAPIAGGLAGGELTRQGISRYHPLVRQAKKTVREGSLRAYTETNMTMLAHGVDLDAARKAGQTASQTYREVSGPTINAARLSSTLTPRSRLAITGGAVAGSLAAIHGYRMWRKRTRK